jgi:hypothetical protein
MLHYRIGRGVFGLGLIADRRVANSSDTDRDDEGRDQQEPIPCGDFLWWIGSLVADGFLLRTNNPLWSHHAQDENQNENADTPNQNGEVDYAGVNIPEPNRTGHALEKIDGDFGQHSENHDEGELGKPTHKTSPVGYAFAFAAFAALSCFSS